MPRTIHVDVAKPLPFVPEPSFDKIESCVATVVGMGATDTGMIHAVLFLATAKHVWAYGRPLHGETWARGYTPYGVFGIVTSAVIGNRSHGRKGTFSVKTGGLALTAGGIEAKEAMRGKLSDSDVEAMQEAYDRIKDLTPEEASAVVRSQDLFGAGADGTLVDWFDGLRTELRGDMEHRDDLAWMILHSR